MDGLLYNSLTDGDFGSGLLLRQSLVDGDFWTIGGDGCHLVYRGQNSNIDYTEVQTLMDIDDSEVTIDHQYLPPGTSWDYIRQQVSGCGLASEDSAPLCKILIDKNGDAFAEVPNPPLNLTATAVAGGKVKLRWRYSAVNQKIKPTCFNVYYDDGVGSAYIGNDGAVDPDAVLILHFDGADGGTDTIDTSGSGHTVTTSGDFELDDAQVKFGNTSGKFSADADIVSVGDHSDFDFGTDALTIMCHFRIDKIVLSKNAVFCHKYGDSTHYVKLYYVENPESGSEFFFDVRNGAASLYMYSDADQIEADTWYHLCVVRSGDDWKLFLNGNVVDIKNNNISLPDTSGQLKSYGSSDFVWWLDDLVATKQALYTAAFDVPTRPYGVRLGDVKARGSGEYSFVTEALTHGKTYNFRVRSYKQGAGESQNSDYVSITADAVGPDAITDLHASWTDK